MHKPNPPESPQCARIILASQPAPAATTLEVAVAAVTVSDRHKGKINTDQIPTLHGPALSWQLGRRASRRRKTSKVGSFMELGVQAFYFFAGFSGSSSAASNLELRSRACSRTTPRLASNTLLAFVRTLETYAIEA